MKGGENNSFLEFKKKLYIYIFIFRTYVSSQCMFLNEQNSYIKFLFLLQQVTTKLMTKHIW